MSIRRLNRWLERIFIFICGSYIGYIVMALATDLRVDDVRPFINEKAIQLGTEYGISAYIKESKLDESYREKRRESRDKLVKVYLQKLQKIMDE